MIYNFTKQKQETTMKEETSQNKEWETIRDFISNYSKELPFIFGIITILSAFLGLCFEGKDFIVAWYKTFSFIGGDYSFGNEPNIFIVIAAFFAPLTVGATLIAVFSRKLKELRFYAYTKRVGGHIVVCGLGDMAYAFADDVLTHKKSSNLVCVELNESNKNIEKIYSKGGVVALGDASNEKMLDKVGAMNADKVVLFTGNDATNLEILAKLAKLANKEDKKVKVYIHLEHRQNHELLENNELKNLDIKSFSIYDNAAQTLFLNHPLGANVDTIKSKKSVRLAIVGFDAVGEAILHRALNLGYFYNGMPLEVSVFTKNAEQKQEEFLQNFFIDLQSEYWHIKFQPESALYKKDTIKEFDQLVFCKQDIDESFSDASKLAKHQISDFKGKQIFVFADTHDGMASLISADALGLKDSTFEPFGEFKKLCSYNVIINETLDNLAKQTNFRYNELHGYNGENDDIESSWNALNAFLKDSNRMQVEHLSIKLDIINKLLKPNSYEYESQKEQALKKWFVYGGNMIWDDMDGAKEITMALSIDEIENIAKTEKRRWNAFHVLNGWKKLDIPDGTKEEIKKDKTNKLHPCLVSWDGLDKVSQNHGHDYRSDDVETIMRSYEMAKKVDNMWFLHTQMENLKKNLGK